MEPVTACPCTACGRYAAIAKRVRLEAATLCGGDAHRMDHNRRSEAVLAA